MKIALVGVSGTGKTTLMTKLEEALGVEKVLAIPEATKGEICKYSNLPLIDHKQATKFKLTQYDIGRVEYQLKVEQQQSQKPFMIFDKAIPVALMYVLTLSARLIPDSLTKDFVQEVKTHVKRNYDLLVYIPYNPKFKAKGLERNFTNSYLLELQDAALEKVINWLDCPKLSLSSTNFDSRLSDVTNWLGVTA
jgi:predicted ATPase